MSSSERIASNMEHTAAFFAMRAAGFQPDEDVKEEVANRQQELNAYAEELHNSLQQRLAALQKKSQSILNEMSAENVREAMEVQISSLIHTEQDLKQKQSTLLMKVEMVKQTLHEQLKHQEALKAHLTKLRAASKCPNGHAQTILKLGGLGTYACEGMGKNNTN